MSSNHLRRQWWLWSVVFIAVAAVAVWLAHASSVSRPVVTVAQLALLVAVAGVPTAGATARVTERLDPMTRTRAAAALIAIVAAGYVAVSLTTPRIDFGAGAEGSGYGHDGVAYGRVADDFEPFETTVARPFSYRPLPAVLVHYMGIGTFRGFHLINALAYALSCLLLYRLLRFYSVARGAAIVGVGFFVCLRFGFKFWAYYPILTDGFGTMLLLAAVYGAISGRNVLYVISMGVAMFCRENLLVLVPFHILAAAARSTSRGGVARAALLNVLPVACFVAGRRFPVVQGAGDFQVISAALHYTGVFFTNPARPVRFVLAHVNSLGVLAVVPLLMPRPSYRFLAAHPHWFYFVVIHLALGVASGTDIDRFAVWQAPALIVLVVTLLRHRPAGLAQLLMLQAVWSGVMIPWQPDEAFYLSRYAAHAGGVDIYLMTLECALFIMVVAAAWMTGNRDRVRPQ